LRGQEHARGRKRDRALKNVESVNHTVLLLPGHMPWLMLGDSDRRSLRLGAGTGIQASRVAGAVIDDLYDASAKAASPRRCRLSAVARQERCLCCGQVRHSAHASAFDLLAAVVSRAAS
jgi:hypothetical protein